MIFKRRSKAAAIESFWTWWESARPRAEKMISGTPDDRLTAELNARVGAIHAGLQWEFTTGSESTHVLVVTSGGDPALRSLAERWRRSSPEPDEIFGYAAARPGNPSAMGGVLQIDGHRLVLSEARFAAEPDEAALAVHVLVWHPEFATMSEQSRTHVAFLTLDWLLGEDAVEIWIGHIAAVSRPGPYLTGVELAEVVDRMEPEDGTERWGTLTGTRRGKPLVALAQVPLKPARWPGCHLHIRIDVPYRQRDENGFPARDSFPALYALEDRITEFADGAVVVAHETCDGVRTTHLYTDRRAAAHALEPLIASWPEGKVRMTVSEDPRWQAVAHLR
jgi:uncharacterized protein DUF695